MKIKALSLAMGLLGLILSQQLFADVSGIVYRELPVNGSTQNTYGIQDVNETGSPDSTGLVSDGSNKQFKQP